MDQALEQKRLNAVRKLEILDSSTESEFDDLVKLASIIFDVPISTVTIVDEHRQWFKAAVGLEVQQTPRDISFCTHTISQDEPMVIGDTAQDARFANSPLVKQDPHLGFYAGVPLKTSDDYAVGAFCIMDSKPRQLTQQQLDILKILANQATKLLELRLERNKYRDLLKEKEKINLALKETAQRWKYALEGVGYGVWDWDINSENVV
ncbi:MAG: GAF domain-containing protein, partial [Methylotenera sp.]